jgi:hypothetical protein
MATTKSILVKCSAEYLRMLLDVPDGVTIRGAYLDQHDLVLICFAEGFPEHNVSSPTQLQIREINNRRGERFHLMLWPGYEKQALNECGLQEPTAPEPLPEPAPSDGRRT